MEYRYTLAVRSEPDEIDGEAALVEAAKINPTAFEPLYQRYKERIYRYLFLRVKREEDAADLTQQVISHGKPATLERVSIAQSSTRIAVLGPDEKAALSATLQTAGKAANSLEDISFATDEPGAWSFIYDGDLTKDAGPWTFTIKQGIYTWVFHFVVPA